MKCGDRFCYTDGDHVTCADLRAGRTTIDPCPCECHAPQRPRALQYTCEREVFDEVGNYEHTCSEPAEMIIRERSYCKACADSMPPSITCPKCHRSSFNEGDISSKYCGGCGYHDAPVDAPLGVPGVSAKWRQPTPVMQLRAELGGLEGSVSNWQDGITEEGDMIYRLLRYQQGVKEILDHMESTGRSDSW